MTASSRLAPILQGALGVSLRNISSKAIPPVSFSFPALVVAWGLVSILGMNQATAAPLQQNCNSGGEAVFDGCTTLAIGREASGDGSVMVTHTCDGHDGRTWIDVVPRRQHPPDARCWLSNRTDLQIAPGDTTGQRYDHWIPQVDETYGYLWGIYPLMNEHQLAIGESTFGGKAELRSEKGLINCYELTRLMAERCRTAREAIALADDLLAEYGYNDSGECLLLADKEEVWIFEVVGPGADKVGAVWAARRIPDSHISVNANLSRIRQIDPEDPDCLASDNVFDTAEELGLWDPASGQPFEFCYAYAGRESMAGRRREWRVYDLLAPSRTLDPNGEHFPLSIKPDTLITVADLMSLYEDTYEDTPFDMTKFMLVPDADGNLVKSPYANPFMAYDQMSLWKINGGWNEKGERTIARFYCIYVFIAQSRAWLPDPIGGLVWFGWDNPAMTCYAPLYNCVQKLPESFRVGGPDGRSQYSRESAWWAFNRASVIAAHRWGDMRHDLYAVRDPLLEQALANQAKVEAHALVLHKRQENLAVEFLTEYSSRRCDEMVDAYWNLGDGLWTKYDGKF